MSRKYAIIAAIAAAIAFAAVYFWPEPAIADRAASPGVSGRLHLGDRAVLSGQRSGSPGPGYVPYHYPRQRPAKPGTRRTLPPRRPPVVVVPVPVPYPHIHRDRVIVREKVVPVPAPQPPAAASVPPPPAGPPDPRGTARTVAVDGPAPREWVLDQVLPRGVPHVVLEPSAYDLPRPPSGQIYARVGDDVLRIEARTRRIIAVLAQ